MWGITTYFNPAGYRTKLRNLEVFAARARRQGLKLMVVELAFEEDPFRVPFPLADSILRVRSNSVLWQKERLLNLAVGQLPATCDKVVLLDGDILFTNDSWVEDTSRLLDEHKIVQPFYAAGWLPADGDASWESCSHSLPGMAYAMRHSNGRRNIMFRPDLAHPGFAWAARREVLHAHGFYDKFILGGGDFVTMLAMYSDSAALANPNVAVCLSPMQNADVSSWIDKLHKMVRCDVGCTPGSVLHLWHGSLANRRYIERYSVLREYNFDPASDIALDDAGCWRWSSNKPELHSRVRAYFSSRKEDETGEQAAPPDTH
jgi:hypothetical protein